MRAILQENGIAIEEMQIPHRYPVISVPIVGTLTAVSLTEDIDLLDTEDIQIKVKEYEFEYERNNTLFYELRKERKKMSKCNCTYTCDCQISKEVKINKFILLGFSNNNSVPEILTSYTGHTEEYAKDLILERAEKFSGQGYNNLKMIGFDKQLNIIFCRAICFDPPIPVEPKARLC